MTAISLATSVKLGQIQQIQQTRLIDFFKTTAPELLQYSGLCFLIGIASISLVILATFGIFKALSYFRQLASF